MKIWTDKKQYQIGEKITIYLKGNKPFFARIIYHDAVDHPIQLIPNPYRSENYRKKGNLPGDPVEFGEVKIEVNTVED